MKIKLASPIQSDSIVDGEGIRSVIWTQGCTHHCPGCHNPETHDPEAGFWADTEDLKKEITRLEIQDGITLSGGDPMLQVDACLDLARFCKSQNLNIWCYTGFTFEHLLLMAKSNPNILELLKNIDVLVDGRFHMAEKSLNLKFRGSRNQRIIDVTKSLECGEVVVIEKYRRDKTWLPRYQTEQFMYI